MSAPATTTPQRRRPLRVLVADDHPIVRDGVRLVVRHDPPIEVVGSAQTGAEAVWRTLELRPDVVAVERIFFQNNVRTAMSVGQASGLAMAEAVAAGCEVVQYSPNEVKLAVTGDGAADKQQVQMMVQRLLGLAAPPRPADAADAAALALCHLAHAPARARIAAASAGARP